MLNLPYQDYLGLNLKAFYANLENFSHFRPPIMNTANESLQPNRTLPRTYALPMLLKKTSPSYGLRL